MNLWTANLLLYCGELALVVAAAWLVSLAPSLRSPRAAHRHWRLVLLACLLLPLFAPRRVVDQAEGTVIATFGAAVPAETRGVDWNLLVLAALASGSAFLLARLAAGIVRAKGWARRATATGQPLVRLSADVKGPVTVGWLRPVILVPPAYLEMPEAQRLAIDAHELAHVERRDWLHLLTEELVRCLLWFHPAIWLVLSRIHLTREQVVDEAAIARTGDRNTYLDTLLAVAGLKAEVALVAAPAFLERRNLSRRLAAIVRAQKPATRLATAMAVATLAAASAFAATLLPMRVPAAPTQLRVGGNRQAEKLIHRLRPAYPAEAKAARIQGTVRMAVIVGKDGRVRDIRVVNGHPLLAPAAVDAVRQWQYSSTLLNGVPVEISTVVDVNFTLRP